MAKKTSKLSIFILIFISKYALSDEAKACFYKDEYFHGEYICMNQGDKKKNLPILFNDKISSISIPFGMEVIVYKDSQYSGIKAKLTENIDMDGLVKLGLNNEISSFRVMPASCFYSSSEFSGTGLCLTTGRNLDLFNENKSRIQHNRPLLSVLNDNILSIKTPEKTQIKLYEDELFQGKSYELTESIDYDLLSKIGMTDNISSIQTHLLYGLSCNLNCVILKTQDIKMQDVFKEVWHESKSFNKQLLLSFDTYSSKEFFFVKVGNELKITIKSKTIDIHYLNEEHDISFSRNQNADNLSLILQIKNNQIQFMYIETHHGRLTQSSPLISYKIDTQNENSTILTIENLNELYPLIMNKAVALADNGQSWSKRDGLGQVACWSIPFLNIYNYIFQGRCNQLDGIVYNITEYLHGDNKGRSLHIAGKAEPLPAIEVEKIQPDLEQPFLLNYIDSNLEKKSISLPATSKACGVSLHPLLSIRQHRQIRPACITWTLEVLTDFTLLFGNSLDTWNTEFFGRVIDSIIQNGNTGSEVADKEVEERLVQGVAAQVALQSPQESATHFKTAFDYAQLSYANYLARNDSPLAASSPLTVEELPLGIYELDLDNYTYQETIPRILEQGHWVLHPELTFEVEFFEIPTPIEQELEDASGISASPSHNESIYQHISRTASLWAAQYETSEMPADPSDKEIDEYKNIIHAGRIVTGIIQRRLKVRRGGEIYVVVKLRGEIITIALADRFLSSHDVELVATATNPRYVLTPNADNTIREGGTVVARSLARYLKQKGARALIAEVISQPSARVKQKVGFNFKDELKY